MKYFKHFLVILAFFVFVPLVQASEKIDVYLFYGNGCPHCEKEEDFLNELKKENQDIEIHKYEVWYDSDNARALKDVARKLGIKRSGVPVLIIGDEYIVGYDSDDTTGRKIKNILETYQTQECSDIAGPIIRGDNSDACVHGCDIGDGECVHDCGCSADKSTQGRTDVPETIDVPLFGEIKVRDVSLPAFTFLIAALDGFNPCAMWVLLFLISLLLGIENKKKMWILGSAFIFTSGFVYFLFLSAWLNIFIFIGFIKWVRIAIALVALWSGYYHLREYRKNKKGTCHVTEDEKRKKTFMKLREVVKSDKFIIALFGIIALAGAVNLVELICSAGLPAVYTQVLSMSGLPVWQYYAYLIFYIFIFMLDDMLVFIVAMKTLQMKAISSKYTRWSNLIGGIVMLIIGLLLLFKPGWLMFG